MSILSNYVPNCLVRAEVHCPVDELEIAHLKGMAAAKKFVQALAIANADVYRATTHNKGIMNGIDSVILATGNDFRAVEAGAHAYAARSGNYKSLSNAWIEGDTFRFALELPLALGNCGRTYRRSTPLGEKQPSKSSKNPSSRADANRSLRRFSNRFFGGEFTY